MSDFTPGPWTVDDFAMADCHKTRVGTYNGRDDYYLNSETICECFVSDYPNPDNESPKIGLRQAEANARLCAAAPDLLSLVERLRQWDHLNGAGDGPYWKSEIDAVLKKARGEQP